MPKGIKWAGRYYSDNILSQTAALRNVGSHRQMTVHADNAGPHVAKCVMEYTDHNSLKRAPHPPYSPDLAPADSYLFGYLKHQLQGHEFTEGAEPVSAISEILNQVPTDTLVNVFDDWTGRLQSYIDISGEYVE
jgi:histone-lysine N-methyltransferase SETMAR